MNQVNRNKILLIIVFMMALVGSLWLSLIEPKTAVMAVHKDDYPSANAIAQVNPQVPVIAESVEYVTIDGQAISGYYAHPKDVTEPLPGIIAIHEWWGLNENIEAMARRLAGEGYQVLAVDLYNGQIAETAETASELVKKVAKNPLGAEANITKAYNYLIAEKQAPKVGSIGWCFGGSWSLETALLFPQELDAAVIYYGGEISKATAEELASLKMPILGIFGAEDSSIPLKVVENFQLTLKKLGKKADIEIYENAGHAFANPSGQNYVAEAAEKAWSQTTKFLADNLSS
jgi:carboxymethylenebutenolidase